MRKLSCDKRGCKRAVYYVEEGCEGIEEELCKRHGDELTLKVTLPNKIKYLNKKIKTIRQQLRCQKSKEGHKFPPPKTEQEPPWKSDHDAKGGLIYGVSTLSTMSMFNGTSHTCTKCGFTYWDPSGILNFSTTNINFADSLKQIKVPELKYTSPSVLQPHSCSIIVVKFHSIL